MSNTEEVMNDLRKAICDIDFSAYDPCSRKFIQALNIGQMWRLLKELEDSDPVSEELDGAMRYIDDYRRTNDTAYKSMAEDELRHAAILISKAKAKMPGGENDPKLRRYEGRWSELSAFLK